MGKKKMFCLILFIFLFSPVVFSNDFAKNAQVDLNSDGKVDIVSIATFENGNRYILSINDSKVDGMFEDGECDGFAIYDIDASDKYKEVAVHTPGPSDDDVYAFYWYDGKTIIKMGEVSRWPEIKGNGIVLVYDWMGFWQKTEKYILEKNTRKLVNVPQEFYYVGIEATVQKTFPIYKTRDCKEVVANLKEKSKILIVLCDPSPKNFQKNEYLIKSESKLLGWCNEKTLLDNVSDLPLAD
ncbi:MAG: hypothetical protein N2445_02130 [Acidobacteria bacterium]|nr:hypothetical protein [Acidobacteriota bacterium]